MNKKKTTAATTPVKVSKKQTLGEFRAWLSGVEEMQSDDWAPDLSQWTRIRERIDEIVEGRSFKSDGTGPSDDDEEPARVSRPTGPSSFAGAIPGGPMMPAPVPPTPPPFMNISGAEGAKIRTPQIDTSGGPYASSLE